RIATPASLRGSAKHRLGHLRQTTEETASASAGATCRTAQYLLEYPPGPTQTTTAEGMRDAALARARQDPLHQGANEILHVQHWIASSIRYTTSCEAVYNCRLAASLSYHHLSPRRRSGQSTAAAWLTSADR